MTGKRMCDRFVSSFATNNNNFLFQKKNSKQYSVIRIFNRNLPQRYANQTIICRGNTFGLK